MNPRDEDWDNETEIEVWGHCGLCGAALHFEDGEVCPVCANPIDDDADADDAEAQGYPQ